MIWTLYKLELFKIIKRLSTWVAYISFAVLTAFMYGTYYYNSIKHADVYFGFPDAWPRVLTDGAFLTATFSAVLIALLIAGEFDWRTSRQNVIDGLSRGQWFIAKLLLIPTVVIFFYGWVLILAITLAWMGTDPDIENAFRLSTVQYIAVAGVFTSMLCYGSIALLISVITRSSGPALGFTLIYQVFENLTTRTLRGFDLNRLADCFPFQIHMAMFRYNQYLPSESAARNQLKIVWETPTLFAACIGWIVFFVLAAWLVYRKRDL